jgi:hypothetical protein
MQLDSSIVSALSAPLGSVVGGSATIAAAWLTQKTQSSAIGSESTSAAGTALREVRVGVRRAR